jgi:hypothetical protein
MDKQLPMKVVGRRGKTKVDAVTFDPMQRMAQTLRRDLPFIPKGVWRFKSFEEADQWTMKMLTRPRNPASQR